MSLVLFIASEHRLENSLSFEKRLDLVFQLLLLDVLLHFLIREQEFSDLELVLPSKTVTKRVVGVVDHVSVKKHFDCVAYT